MLFRTPILTLGRSTKVFKLSTGNLIPAVGLGTWQSTDDEVYNAVLSAIKAGYKHIDTASGYGNEEAVGRAIKDSGIPRDEIFVTTKLGPIEQSDPQAAIDRSLKKLGLDYVDLYLMHWPVALNPNGNSSSIPTLPNGDRDLLLDFNIVDGYKNLEKIYEQGKAKAIGVSNFTIKNLSKLLNDSSIKVKPAVNQIELHPYLPQLKLVEFCKENGIQLEAYSPLGSTNSPLISDKIVSNIAEKHNVSPATILISWAIWRGIVVLPKSVTPSRVESNLNVISLRDEEGEQISNIHKEHGIKRFIVPNWKPIVVFDSDE